MAGLLELLGFGGGSNGLLSLLQGNGAGSAGATMPDVGLLSSGAGQWMPTVLPGSGSAGTHTPVKGGGTMINNATGQEVPIPTKAPGQTDYRPTGLIGSLLSDTSSGGAGWIDSHRNQLMSMGAAMLSPHQSFGEGLSAGLSAGMQGEAMDRKRAGQNATAQWLKSQKDADPAMVAALDANPDLANQYFLQRIKPKDYGFVADGVGGVLRTDPTTGDVTSAYQGKPKPNVDVTTVNNRLIAYDKNTGQSQDITPKDMPASFRPMSKPERQLYGVPDDAPAYMTPDGPKTLKLPAGVGGAQKFTDEDKKAILGADDAVSSAQAAIGSLDHALAVSPEANAGAGASMRAWAGNNLPDWMVPDAVSSPQSSAATADLQNTTTATALSQLKSVFGGNPTEGERKIMLDVQGSADQPRAVREEIFTRAKAAAQRRLAIAQQRAAELRGGKYFGPGGGSGAAGGGQSQTSGGLSWSVEP